MLTAYQQKELDILNVPMALYGEVLDKDGRLNVKYTSSHLRVVPLNNLKFLAFRMGAGPWGTDVALRKKVYDSVDRPTIVTNLFRGQARAAWGVVPQWEDRGGQSVPAR